MKEALKRVIKKLNLKSNSNGEFDEKYMVFRLNKTYQYALLLTLV